MRVQDFAEGMVVLSLMFRGSVTSWCRTRARNQAVGGHPQSYHLLCLGADLVFDSAPDQAELSRVAAKFGLKVIDETDHFHVQPL